MNIALPVQRYRTGDDRLAFFEELERRVAALPGVRSVAFANRLPLRGGWESGLTLEALSGPSPGGPGLDAGFQAVSPGYFATLGIPLTRGRLVSAADRKDTLPVALVTEQFVRRFLSGADPLGRRFRRGPQAPWITIVGVVADVRRDGKTAAVDPQVYLPAAQTGLYPTRLSDLAVRADGNPAGLVPAIRSRVWSVDREQPVTAVRTLEEVLVLRSAERRFQTLLFVLFAVLALALAVVGIYGVVAYAVSQRLSEIGIRMALGADRSNILGWIVAKAAWLVFGGAAAGLSGAWALSRSLRGLLFEVAPTDPATYVAATLALAAVGLGASYVAARRATNVDPLVALRCE
jgi:predicted permease